MTHQAGSNPQQGEPQAPSGNATTVVVKQGDTIWGYWKAYDHARPWQDFKHDFIANNATILADGWLHPGEVAIVRPALPEPVAAPVLPEPGNGNEPIVPVDITPPEPIPPPVSTQQPAATLPSTTAPTPPTTPVTVPPVTIATVAPPAAVLPVNPQGVTQGGGYFDLWSGGVSNLLADTANRSLDVLFATNMAASVAVKGFTPNLDAAWTKAKFGEYETGGGSGKLHGWLAARGEASVSASWINDSGVRMRSGTFSITLSVQQEAIGELNLPKGDARVLATGNESVTLSYTITITEDRLEDIMTGRIAAPNPFTLEGMKPGDSISVFEGTGLSGELEGRLLAGKGPLRAGLDIKGDDWSQSGQKITIRMVANPDPAKADQPHVVVLDGDRDTSGNAIGFGLIWNPKITQGSVMDKYSQGNFMRGLLQVRDTQSAENYNFVEINPYDNSPGGGRDLYRRILTDGVVDYDPATGEIPGAVAHGTMTVDSTYDSATLQFTGYVEPRQKDRNNHLQFLSQYSIDLVAMIDDRSSMRIRHAEPGSVLGDTGDLVVNARFSNGTSTNYFHRYRINAANYKAEETFNLTAESVSREQLARHLDTNTFSTIRLHLKDGTVIEGQDAVDWLTHNKDGWFGGNDKVGVVLDMGTTAEADTFSASFIADQKKWHDDQQDNVIEKFFYWLGQSQSMSQEVALASLAAPDVFADPDQPWNLDDHQNAQSANENFRAMSGSGMGNLIGSIDQYHRNAGRGSPYPVAVDVYVDWK